MAVVVVPWAPGCPHRQTAWDWVRAHHEDAGRTVVEAHAPPGPWVKALAVMPAIEAATAAVVVVADADVFCDGLVDAIDAVEAGAAWAVPHRRVKRLSQTSTERVFAGEEPYRLGLDEPSYIGALTGGLVVLRRDVALDVPLDPRFVGWGGEDRSWGSALCLLHDQPWRGEVNLFHLWHPPQPRPDRNHGSEATEALRARYRAAEQRPAEMRALIEEVPWHSIPSQNSVTSRSVSH